MIVAQPTGLHPGQAARPASAPVVHQHVHAHQGHDHRDHATPDHAGHDHAGHDNAGSDHAPRTAIEALLSVSPATFSLSPLASAGASRVAKTAGALALLWVAVAWALGWLGA